MPQKHDLQIPFCLFCCLRMITYDYDSWLHTSLLHESKWSSSKNCRSKSFINRITACLLLINRWNHFYGILQISCRHFIINTKMKFEGWTIQFDCDDRCWRWYARILFAERYHSELWNWELRPRKASNFQFISRHMKLRIY